MGDVEIVHPVPADEVGNWVRTMSETYLSGGGPDDRRTSRIDALRRGWSDLRSWGAWSGGRCVATLGSRRRGLTLPGPSGSTRDLDVDAVTMVSVAATHRRRGVLTRMMTEELREARERGDVLSILIPAEWPIYGRYGYAPASETAHYSLFLRDRESGLVASSCEAVRQVEADEVAACAPGLYEQERRLWPGSVDRRGSWWSRRLGHDGYRYDADRWGGGTVWTVHDGAGGPDGVLGWTVDREDDETSLAVISVRELIATTPGARSALWAYLAGIDLVGEVRLTNRPVDEPARWLLRDARSLRQTLRGDWLWLRLLDVPAALTARGYATAGRLVLDVLDQDPGGWTARRVRLDTDGVQAECRPTCERADLRLTQRALASVYLGGYSLTDVADGGAVEELTSGALARADALFSTPRRPWNPTPF